MLIETLLGKPSKEQTIALAGVFQACELVDKLATTGSITPQQLETSISSLLNQNPTDTASVYSGTDNLRTGLDVMEKLLGMNINASAPNPLRYAVGILYLQRRLSKDRTTLNKVGQGIERAAQQAEHFGPTHENVLNNLADLYQQTISTYSFRIQVKGEPDYLQQEAIATRIRCLLFSAIRSAVLYEQLGGRRRHMIFSRKSIIKHVRALKRLH